MAHEKKSLNKWKIAFISLVSLNIVLLIFVIYFLTSAQSNVDAPYITEKSRTNEPTFTITTTKDKVNELVNNYLTHLLHDKDFKYSISLDDYVSLHGEFPLFGLYIPLKIDFEPVVLHNGDLLFKQKSISLGRLHLPSREVMEFISQSITVPDWVQVDPEHEQIYVQMTKINKNGIAFRVDEFDLINDRISFHIDVLPHDDSDTFEN